MATWALWACGCVVLAFYRIPSTSAACQKSSDYNRTLLVPLNGTAAFVCNVTDAEVQLYVEFENHIYWWPFMDLKSIAGIHPQLVDSNRTINVTINGNNTFLNKTWIGCNCFSSTENIFTFVTTIFIYDPPSPPANLTVTEIVGARVSISWSTPFAPSGVALWYRVRIADLSSTQIPTLYLSNATHYETSHLNCLQCEITVVAANEAGESVPSDSVLLLFNRTTTANETGESVPSDSVLFNRTASAVPLFVCVVVVPVGGLVIVVIIAIAIVAVVRRKRTRRLKLQAPCPAGQTATQRDPRDTPVSLNAYQTPHA